jgi:flavin-dependent dehydrogenase
LKKEGKVVVDGFHMIGDALVCTNPLYGRGCSTGFWQAHLLADAIRDHGSDSLAQSESFLQTVEGNILPWYQASVDSDRGSRAIADGVDDEMTVMKRSILKEGLMPATQSSAKVWRGFMKMMNLLADPSILSEPEISAEIMKVWADRDQRNQEAPLGPSREEMIGHLKLTNVS